MLTITIPSTEFFDDKTQTFHEIKGQTLQLEHSLVSLARWESKWHKPFLSKEQKTLEETIDYFRCMTITQNVNPMIYYAITNPIMKQINEYIEDPMTATWFNDAMGNSKPNREVVTAELIYYWMIALNIPMECQKWHLNRLLTLVRVCNIKNTPSKKMSAKEAAAQRRALNAERRGRFNSRG